MEEKIIENTNKKAEEKVVKEKNINYFYFALNIILFAGLIFLLFSYQFKIKTQNKNISAVNEVEQTNALENEVLPVQGIALPVKWGNLGKKMVEIGIIDATKFEALYNSRGGLDQETKKLLYEENNDNLVITPSNAGVILNLLWAFGIANKNEILEKGPMTDSKYGGAQIFASTGGWTLAKGNAMNYYSKYELIKLTPDQQKLVEEASKNIYRPCCDNSTYFPDCNHGMAMLGLLELLAASGLSLEEMYKIALQVNAYWFPDSYLTIAKYFESKGINWKNVNPREVLGFDYSSASGFSRILKETTPVQSSGGESCGV